MRENNEELFKRLITDNKLDIKNEKEFEIVARNYTTIRSDDLRINPIKGNFDYQHLKNIHKYVFQDVFYWAGKDRMEVGLSGFMSKGDSLFCSAEYIPGEAKKIFDNLAKNNYLKSSKDLNHFAKDLANFMSDLNALHPFREGNGRTQRIFLNELAKNAGYKLDLNLIPKKKIIEASIEAMECRNGKLEAVIKTNLKSFRQNLDLEQNKGISL